MELDEMHSYVGNKNYQWIWIAVDRDSREYIDMVVGSGGTKTWSKLWDQVEKQSTGVVATDYWRVYNEIIPLKKLVQTKAETYTVESYNSQIGHFLVRFRENLNTIHDGIIRKTTNG